MLSTIVVVVVVMRCRGVQRSKASGRGVGRWHHWYGKYADLLSTRERKGSIFGFFHPETRFQKCLFTGAAFTGSMWTISQNNAKHVFTQKSTSVWTAPQSVSILHHHSFNGLNDANIRPFKKRMLNPYTDWLYSKAGPIVPINPQERRKTPTKILTKTQSILSAI